MLYSVEGCPKNRVRWCGPSAITAITGIGYPAALTTLKQVRANRSNADPLRVIVKGIYNNEMSNALRRLGYRMTPINIQSGITFARFLRERSPEERKATILVSAGHHYMVVSGNKAVDGIVKDPVFISKMPGRRKRMAHAWIITRVSPVTPKALAKAVVKTENQQRGVRAAKITEAGRLYRRAKAISTEMGLTIKVLGHDEIEVLARPGHLIDEVSGRVFSGSDRWESAVDWLGYLHDNGIEQEVNPDDLEEAA